MPTPTLTPPGIYANVPDSHAMEAILPLRECCFRATWYKIYASPLCVCPMLVHFRGSDNGSGSIQLFHCDRQVFTNTRFPPLPPNIRNIPSLQVARFNLGEVKLHQLSWYSTLLPVLGSRCIPRTVTQISAREPDPGLGFGIFGYRHLCGSLAWYLYCTY